MARPRKYSDQQMIEALHKTKGMVYLAADIIGCEADTIYDRAKVSPSVKTAMTRESERSVDLAEITLLKQINEGNTTALIFYLKTKGKHRGYVERSEVLNIPADIQDILKSSGMTYTEAVQQWHDMIRQAAEAKHGR